MQFTIRGLTIIKYYDKTGGQTVFWISYVLSVVSD